MMFGRIASVPPSDIDILKQAHFAARQEKMRVTGKPCKVCKRTITPVSASNNA